MARQERKLSEPPRRITALPDFKHSTPASAATLGRLSKMTAMTPSGTRTRSMVMPFGRCQLSVTVPIGSAMPRTIGNTIRHRVDARWCQRQAVDEGRRRAAGAHLGDILGIGGENGRRVGADRALHRLQRPVLLLRRGKRQHPCGSACAGSEFGHQSRQIGVAVDRLQRRGHPGGLGLRLRPCSSMEIEDLARSGTGMAAGRLGVMAARPLAERTW